MTQRVAGGGLVDRRQLPRRPHGTLQHAVVDMMPPQLPRTRIDRALRREAHVLPARLASRVREFARQRVRQPDLTEPFRQVRSLQQAVPLDGPPPRLATPPTTTAPPGPHHPPTPPHPLPPPHVA